MATASGKCKRPSGCGSAARSGVRTGADAAISVLTPIQARRTHMSFRITGLPAGYFAHLFDLTDDELAARGAVRRIADAPTPGYPCRVSLTDSRAGDELL